MKSEMTLLMFEYTIERTRVEHAPARGESLK